ncbi:MAG: YkgJ family cysteine cluster protein [Desulfobulbaceae bacterium]|nr:YkgJ family cysteine cluster protein [Desulfobulbaceae bacterium]
MDVEISSCKKCGNCCEKGGPALHIPDLKSIKNGNIPISSLITIRKGELVHNPLVDRIKATTVELVKLVGTGRTWDCCYYKPGTGCTIYEHRPHACRVLKCWDTGEILALVEKDTLDRFAILEKDDPLIPIIREHERICPCDGLEFIQANRTTLSANKKAEIEKIIRLDLRFRSRVINDFGLKLNEEMFYFGRPIFQLLSPFGVHIYESGDDIHVKW